LLKVSVKNIFKSLCVKAVMVLIFLGITAAFPLKTFAGENINVVFTIDKNYPLYTMLVINSILKHNVSKSDYTFYVINNNLSSWDELQMKYFVKYKKQKIVFIKVDADAINKGKDIYSHTFYCPHVTSIGTVRMMIPRLLPNDVKKALYLDSDILVLKDLKELYDTDLGKYYAAMGWDNKYLYLPRGKKKGFEYFNSGVILMDLDKWRKDDISEKIIDYITSRTLILPDQDAINKILHGKIKVFDPKWNNQYCLGILFTKLSDTGIIHYISSRKPWILMRDRKTDNFIKIYYDYWNCSPLVIYRVLNVYSSYISSQVKRIKINYVKMKGI